MNKKESNPSEIQDRVYAMIIPVLKDKHVSRDKAQQQSVSMHSNSQHMNSDLESAQGADNSPSRNLHHIYIDQHTPSKHDPGSIGGSTKKAIDSEFKTKNISTLKKRSTKSKSKSKGRNKD